MNKNFSSPIDASTYNASLSTVHGIQIQSIDYEAGVIRWRPIDDEGEVIGTGIFGTNTENPTEGTAASRVRAEIAATAE